MKTLHALETKIKQKFERNQRLLTFEEYLSLLQENPKLHLRGSARYIIDMMDFFGSKKEETLHFKLFDQEFSDPRHRVIAQNSVQTAIYKSLQNFEKEGINNKLLLLHGPNGSAKTSLVQCISHGLEHFSAAHEGAIYKFNWIFPVEKITKGSLGLGGGSYTGEKAKYSSFAKLEDEDIAARVPCELKDHPFLLIPVEERQNFLQELVGPKAAEELQKKMPEYLTKGELCHKCKSIFEALLISSKGDLKKVFQHIQIERFYFSKRYRNSVVTIEPQLHVDAQSRQVTMDKSLAFLPPSLQGFSLFELSGDLVDGNRGMVEFSDLLKRPVDTYKYLLGACETGSVNVGSSIAYLDTVFIGSTNELQLDAFKEFPDFTSFKARIELIRVPYLLDYSQEKQIYDIHIQKTAGLKHVTPHTTFVAALWAVLTRLKKPNPIHYPPALANIVGGLTPLEKAKLYDHLEMPHSLSSEEKKLLKGTGIKKLKEEYNNVPYYEGRIGASAREIKSILFDAAQNQEFECLSPIAILKELESFVKRVSEYEFLKQDIKDGYHDNSDFIKTVREEYLNVLDQEVRSATGVFAQHQYSDFLKKYIQHLSHLLKKEKVKNPITGSMESPDHSLLEEFEKIIEAPVAGSERDIFRNNIISMIGAYSLDHPNAPVDYSKVFPDFIKKLENFYFNQQKSQMKKLADAVQYFGTEKEEATGDSYTLARKTITSLKSMGYCENCASQAILFLVRQKQYQ
jgi:serine protein kinase